MPRVGSSRTAEYMALFRALETARPSRERLFSDPHAASFLTRRLRFAAWLARFGASRAAVVSALDLLAPGARAAGVARTRLIDDALGHAIRRGIDRVVLLGAGFDCRAYRLPALAKTRVFEVDHPRTLAEKRRGVARLLPAAQAEVVFVPIDFECDLLGASLQASGFEAGRPAFFVWEGVTNYLSARAVESVLAFVGSTAPGSQLLFTYVHRDAVERPMDSKGIWLLRLALRRFGEPWTFGLDPSDLVPLLRAHGLSLIQDMGSLDYRARYLGARGRHLTGYEFYRAAWAVVDGPAQGR